MEVLSLLFRYNRFKNCKLPYINHKFPTYLCKTPPPFPPPPGTVQYYKLPPSPSPSRYKPSSLYIVACVEASVKTSQRKSYSDQHCYKKLVLLTFFFSGYCKQGFWCFAEKNAKFRGIFRGKFAEKSADFAGFSREKSQNSPENRSISRDFIGKSQISKDSGLNS